MSTTDFFKVVPQDRQLAVLFDDQGISFKNVVNFVGLSRLDVANALKIESVDTIRFDRPSIEVNEYLTEVATTCEALAKIFNKDTVKIKMWLSTPNAAFNNNTPLELIKSNSVKKLLVYINESIK